MIPLSFVLFGLALGLVRGAAGMFNDRPPDRAGGYAVLVAALVALVAATALFVAGGQ